MLHLAKRLKRGLPYRTLRSFLSVLLSISFILTLAVPAYTGDTAEFFGLEDSLASGSALSVEDRIEDHETEPPQDTDIFEDVETEMTTAYIENNEDDKFDDTLFEKSLITQTEDGSKITVKYRKDAGIPNGAELKASIVSSSDYISKTAETLGWTDEELILYTKFYDISILKDGTEIEPKTAVIVTAELPDADTPAEGMQVVHFDENGAEEIETRSGEDEEVVFAADSFSVYGFGTALHTVMSENSDFADISVYSYGTVGEFDADNTFVEPPEEGIEPSKAFCFAENEQNTDAKYWVKAELGKNALLSDNESYALYSFIDGKAADIIIDDISAENGLCAVDEKADGIVLMKDTGCRRRTLEVTAGSGNKVTLDGLMPKAASAEAEDVTADLADESSENCIAAYDITIKNGEKEYQPNEEHPVEVRICDSRISANDSIKLLHIKDSGEKEEILDFTAENGKIRFDAEGFSIYEIVKDANIVPSDFSFIQLATFSDLIEYLDIKEQKSTNGIYIGAYGNNVYLTSEITNISSSRTGITKTDQTTDYDTAEDYGAVKYYLEDITQGDNTLSCHIYCYDNTNTKKYVKQSSNSLSFTSYDNATLFTVKRFKDTDNNGFYIEGANSYCWNQQGGNSGKSFAAYNSANDANAQLKFYKIPDDQIPDDPYSLDGKEYGLMHYTANSTTADALMAEGESHSLKKLVIRAHGMDKPYYVDENNEITKWEFTNILANKYTLSAYTSSGKVYLCADSSGISTTSVSEDAAVFKVIPGTGTNGGKIQLLANGYYITFVPGESGSFGTTASSTSNTWLDLADNAHMGDNELITYSAERVSVSDVKDKQKVIVYTRIWNETDLKYDMYAIDYDGRLYPCYASGGKILWLGDGTCSLEWEFTEYLDAVTKQPNYYYELYNPYSEKYIAPQLTEDKEILSDNTLGINMPGRKNGEFYSDIIAWDNTHYAYIGLKPNDDKTRLIPCAQSVSVPFYFATLEEINYEDKLHVIDTIDNTSYGITMKMKDFSGTSGGQGATEQNAVLKNTEFVSEKPTQGILSNNLNASGYPTATATNTDLSVLYSGAATVNHLFIDSIYNSSGYFEFDSCQNFASLQADNNFKVYKELGTSDGESKSTLKHGQFFPYNNISVGNDSKDNPQTLYSADARTSDASLGVLDEDDPRKYERLFSAGNKDPKNSNPINYYFGMELSAEFVQTVSGLDAWGHDIIFNFQGDDDFWFYVDDELVIDLGGIHSALEGKVNFRTGQVIVNGEETTLKQTFINNYKMRYKAENGSDPSDEQIKTFLLQYFQPDENAPYGCENIFRDYSTHKMRIFYMERGAGASNLHMRFNLAAVTPGNVVVTKELTGEGADDLDIDFIEYPFQIYYTIQTGVDENEQPVYERKLLKNTDEYVGVTYQNSSQPVRYIDRYVPPGADPSDDSQCYNSIYFINPKKSAEISFPDIAISYEIVECAVDNNIYDSIMINGEPVPPERVSVQGELKSYASDAVDAEHRPNISFNNHVADNVVRTLKFTKKLYDENDEEMNYFSQYEIELMRAELKETYPDETEEEIQERINQYMADNHLDSSTFSFRLSLSNSNVPIDEIPLADMYKYYVGYKEGNIYYICRYDSTESRFKKTDLQYNHETLETLNSLTDDECFETYGFTINNITFSSSGFGAISGIPANYTVLVPALPAGTLFKVTEDSKQGYGLKEVKGYEHVMGQQINGEEITPVNSYVVLDTDNVGKVITGQDPLMYINNKKGYGLTVKKTWSDLSITTHHTPIYVAVYVDGALLDGSVRRIASPSTSTYYFWSQLKPKADSTPRVSFAGYEVKEVVLTGDITVDANGVVTSYDTLTPLAGGDTLNITATRTAEATPEGETPAMEFGYVATYSPGENAGSSRTDTITNTREGGLQIRLFKWGSTVPLLGGCFTLTDSSGAELGTYRSTADGTVTILYNFDKNTKYTLTQTAAPKGYVGLQQKFVFEMDNAKNVILYKEDKTTAWADTDWANTKAGEKGIDAFIDVYNKSFTFKIMKTDSEDSSLALTGAHFALYKQANTAISGLVKNKSPMTGFEDFYTVNGEVTVSGGDTDRTLTPGENGSTYFLTEISAPSGYTKLEEDIVFRLSPIGVPSLVRDAYNGTLEEQEDCYVYTLSVPNSKELSTVRLTINKGVGGNMGNKHKDYRFTIEVEDAAESDEYAWTKNGEEQAVKLKSGYTFDMTNADIIVIELPKNAKVTITEENEDYKTQFTLGGGEAENTNTKTFEITDDITLNVSNVRSAVLPTGIKTNVKTAASVLSGIIAAIILLIVRQKKLRASSGR